LALVFRVGSFCAFQYRNCFLSLCSADGFAKRSLNLSLVGTYSREKHTAEAVQFGAAPPFFGSFDQGFRLPYRLKSFGGTIGQMQSFSL
jgi:hypothetical protein